MTPDEFRGHFPALHQWAWFDTPGCPPALDELRLRLTATIDDWSTGSFSWQTWDASVERARELFAQIARVEVSTVAAMGSVAEAMSTVVRSAAPGSIVISEQDYRSVLLPARELVDGGHQLIVVPSPNGLINVDELIGAIRGDTVLVACSDTLTSTGERIDFAKLTRAAHRNGATVFADLTQSFGVLTHDLTAYGVDYVAVHGYKWLLCPRGAAWLYVAPERLGALRPLLPSWKSTAPPYGYFGAPASLALDAGKLDTSPAWLSWIGSIAALEVMASLPARTVEDHCVNLARRWWRESVSLGFRPLTSEQVSHIAVVDIGDRDADELRSALQRGNVRASIYGSRLRIGVHYFNNDEDVSRCLTAMASYPSSR